MSKYHQPLKMNSDQAARLTRVRSAGDGDCVAVGGMASRLGQLRGPAVTSTLGTAPSGTQRISAQGISLGAIARLLQLARREAQQTPEQFAQLIGIGVDELVSAEAGTVAPEPRVLYVISEALEVSYQKLLILAGHRRSRDERLEQEGLRFAASSAPMDKLSDDELQALHSFLRVLHDE